MIANFSFQNDGLKISLFTAPWCGSCKIMKKKFPKLANRYENLRFSTCDTSEVPDRVRAKLNVMSLNSPILEKGLFKDESN